MNISQRRDLVAGICFVVVACAILFLAIPYGVQEPKKVKFVALSPSYYPRLVCYCLLGFGLFLLLREIISSRKDDAADVLADSRIKPLVFLLMVVIFSFYYLTLPFLGFVLSSAIVLFILLLLAGDRNIISLVLIPLLLPISVYWFFTKVANIPIPSGILAPLLTGS